MCGKIRKIGTQDISENTSFSNQNSWKKISKICLFIAISFFVVGVLTAVTGSLPLVGYFPLIVTGILLSLAAFYFFKNTSISKQSKSDRDEVQSSFQMPKILQGSADIKIRKFEIPGEVQTLQIHSDGNFTIRHGECNDIQMTGDDNILQRLSWKIGKDLTLLPLSGFESVRPTRPLECIITLAKSPKTIKINGSLSLRVEHAQPASDVQYEIHGKARVEIQGILNHLIVTSHEESRFYGGDARCESANICIEGKGSVNDIRLTKKPKIHITNTGQATCSYILLDSEKGEICDLTWRSQ